MGLAQDVHSVTGYAPMRADDEPRQNRAVAAIDGRPMPNPHYDRLPAGYQPLELRPREEAECLLDTD